MEERISLPKHLSFNTVNELLCEVKESISRQNKLVIDARNVEEIDALGLQLIISIEKTARINEAGFEIINLSHEMKKAIQSL